MIENISDFIIKILLITNWLDLENGQILDKNNHWIFEVIFLIGWIFDIRFESCQNQINSDLWK